MRRNHQLPEAVTVDLADVDATVLVVDDDEDLADTYALWLDDVLDVHTAYSGSAALDVLDAESVDVVLLDRRMPSMSGDALLAELRERGYEPRVAMVTAIEPDRDVVEMPFDDYLVKPVSREAVYATVADLLALEEHAPTFREYVSLEAKLAVIEAGSEYRGEDDPEELESLRERVARQRERALETLEDVRFDDDGSDGLTDTG